MALASSGRSFATDAPLTPRRWTRRLVARHDASWNKFSRFGVTDESEFDNGGCCGLESTPFLLVVHLVEGE